ncbi:cohesin subunit SA-3 isoform X2 [Anolis carolinensis]|uniref:cohesin subunit SA-3 isoform X2 n=1 Tax=Anolis carolinensis TaxID=28377 RepID=UPI002F2B2ED9
MAPPSSPSSSPSSSSPFSSPSAPPRSRSLRQALRPTPSPASARPPGSLSSSDDEEGDSGSDFEATLRLRSKKKRSRPAAAAPAAKRPRRRGTAPEEAGKGSRKHPKGGRRGEEEAAAGGSLFQAVSSGKSATESLVDDWLEGYKQDKEGGFLELVNFLVRSCGCKGTVTLEMLSGLQNSEIIQRLTESFDEESAEYPLSLNSPAWRRFRVGFCELIAVLVRRAQHGVIYDEYLMDSLVALLTGMSDSQVRAFRHTSTLAAMKLMTALVRVALSISVQKDNRQRQYEAERAKGLNRRAPEKMEELLEQRREFQEKQEELESLMNAIFKGVFVHRYRDLVPEIRAICIEEMGQWMQYYSTSFLTDGYLKYIGWTLHDKQGEVRLKCLLALKGLYRDKETAARMELFTSRFKERMVSMVLDKELQVAVEAVRLLTLILQNMEDVLTDSDCESIFPLVYASSRPMASAAGEFLHRKLLAPATYASGEAEGCSEDSRTFLQSLLCFFIESEFHDHAAYLVDSLWDCAAPLLKDWPVLTGLLLEEPPLEGLGDRQENALIMILVSSMRQATEGHPPVGRASGKKAFSARERKMQAEDRRRLTQHLIPLLPQLIAKFSADAEKVVSLLEAPGYFDLALYSTGRLEKYLELLLVQLREVVEKHSDPEVLGAASRALHLLCRPELTFFSRADFARSRLVDHLADKFQHKAKELFQNSVLKEEDAYSMAATLKRIAIFHSAHDLTPWGFFEPCKRLLHHAVDTGEVPQEVVTSAMTCCHFSLLWELAHISGSADELSPSQEQVLSLKKKVKSFCSLCQRCFTDTDPKVQEQAFVLLSDLLLVFSPQSAKKGGGGSNEGSPGLAALAYQAEPALQSQMACFLLDHVFSHCQDQDSIVDEEEDSGALHIERLHQRRNLLAGFCKLVIYGVLELSAASDVFKYYAKCYNDYGDIIKETLNRVRQIDRTEWAQTLLLSLQQLLAQLLLEQGPGGVESEAFQEIRDLARRFSLLFGLHQLQNRSALVALHKAGIKFAFQEAASPNAQLGLVHLPFLELLSEFSPRLMHPDKALLLSYLKRFCPAAQSEEPHWTSFLVYQHSLSPQEEERPKSAAKRSRLDGSSSSELRVSDASLPSSRSSSRLQTPLLTSTALRVKDQAKGGLQLKGQVDSGGSESEFVLSHTPLPTQGGPPRRHRPQPQLPMKGDHSGLLLGRRLDRQQLMEAEEVMIESLESSQDEEEENDDDFASGLND